MPDREGKDLRASNCCPLAMGNCCGRAREKSTYQGSSSRAKREQTWHATGTIALRDGTLKVLTTGQLSNTM